MDTTVPPAAADARGTPTGRERLAIVALAIVAFALNLNTNVLGALLPFVPEEVQANKTSLLAAAAGGSGIGALWVLSLARRHGKRNVLLAGLCVFVVASALHVGTDDAHWLLVLRAVSGLSVGVAYAAASALVAEIVPYARRGAAMGLFTAGMFLAIPVGMPISVVLAVAGNWQLVFGVQAAIGAVGAWLAWRAVPRTGAGEMPGALSAVLRNGPVVAVLVATMLHVGSFFTTLQLGTTWLDETGMVPRDSQLWLWVGLGIASVAGSALLGRVSDWVGKRYFVLATSALLVACFLVLAREPHGWLLLAVGTTLAVSASARTGPLQALASGLVPKNQLAAVMAVRGGSMQFGVFGFALAAGPTSRDLGFAGVLFLAAACQAISFLAIRVFAREGS